MLDTSFETPVWFGDAAFDNLQRLIDESKPSRIFFLVDENTHEKCLPLLLQSLGELPANEVLEVAAGEDSKSPEVLVQLWYALSELQADRQCLLINLGGGVVTDLGGFLAGTFLRGVSFVNIPTSLLAMVDASVGGKTGINLGHEKNRVGIFLEPEAVCVVPGFLETLPARERRSGFAEMLKHGVITDVSYWEELSAFDIENEIPGKEMLVRSVEIKKAVVEKDFRESGLRKVLNFGHTVGHAIESASLESQSPLLHGEAIALGMMAELMLSEKFTAMPAPQARDAIATLRMFYPELSLNFDAPQLIPLMYSDKKNVGGELRFSLLKSIGHAVSDVAVPQAAVESVLAELKKLYQTQ